MDTAKTITHVSLCAGYGGIDLGLRRVLPTLRTIAYAEREGFCCANLVSKAEAGLMDAAPIWTDVKTFPWSDFCDRVDILSGGYPCQPFSAAGKRLGAEDPRHLWPFISAGIALMRPSVCFFENVEGHISLGLSDVLQDLAGLGYRATWCVASASECGAPHQRKRVFILAYDQRQRIEELSRQIAVGSQQHSAWDDGDNAWPSRPGEQQHAWEPPRVVVDAKSQRAGQRSELRSKECGSGSALSWDVEQPSKGVVANDHSPHAGHGAQRPERTAGDLSGGCGEAMGNAENTNRRPGVSAEEAGARPDDIWRRRSGESSKRTAFASLGRDIDGALSWSRLSELSGLSDQELAEIRHWMVASDNRTDELRLLGNGVVPACAERAFRLLVSELMEHQP